MLKACGYSSRQEADLEANRGGILEKMRHNRASQKLFRKYGWNSIDSSWSPLF